MRKYDLHWMEKPHVKHAEEILEIDNLAENGVYCVAIDEPINFDLRKATKYVKEHKLDKITDKVIEMFKI